MTFVAKSSVSKYYLDRDQKIIDTASIRNLENPNSKTGKINYRLTDSDQPIEDYSPQFQTAGKNAQTVRQFTEEANPAVVNQLDPDQRTELLIHFGDNSEGYRVVNDLGPERTERLFGLSFEQVDEVKFRANLIQHGDEIAQQHSAHTHFDPIEC
ncbi:hypothetical protein GRS80_13575 [Natrialba sp. INN-245]|nr:hypothetical protein [Natrialba sp. INN-245]